MATVPRGDQPLPFPYPVTSPDRIPAKRYYDQAFFDLERERLWPRVWQMACRLEEIPKRGDYVVYENLDQSVIVLRVDDRTIKAYHNHCRHRGVQLAKDRGCRPGGFVCPFHGWAWNVEGQCTFVFGEELFKKDALDPNELRLRECRVETWGGCAFINMDDNAPPLRDSIASFADLHDPWHVDTLRVEHWFAMKIPCNWKLAMEAFMEGYHVMATHPQLLGPDIPRGRGATYGRQPDDFKGNRHWTMRVDAPPVTAVDARQYIDANLNAMRILNRGMSGMTDEKDIRIAEGLRDTRLPSDPAGAMKTWRRTLNEAVMKWHRSAGLDVADLNFIDETDRDEPVNFCFPHFFLLPTYSSASSYRIRPLGPEECLFELWSLTRFPPGQEPPPIRTPTPLPHDAPVIPEIPAQDYSNLPRQQKGLHTKGFEHMLLSEKVEGLISNYHRLIDGYLGGKGYDRLTPAAKKVSGPIDMPILDLGL
ncbi:MAG: SRPBCC family protein [Gammaproteobacteria bacterium]